jgi:hypothetical protein
MVLQRRLDAADGRPNLIANKIIASARPPSRPYYLRLFRRFPLKLISSKLETFPPKGEKTSRAPLFRDRKHWANGSNCFLPVIKM